MSTDSQQSLADRFSELENKEDRRVSFKVQPYLTGLSYHLSQDPTTSHPLHCCNWILSYPHLGNQSSLNLPFVAQFTACPPAILSVLSTKHILNQPTSFHLCCIHPDLPRHHHLRPDCTISLVCFHCPAIRFPRSTAVISLKCKSYHSPAEKKALIGFPLHLE